MNGRTEARIMSDLDEAVDSAPTVPEIRPSGKPLMPDSSGGYSAWRIALTYRKATRQRRYRKGGS